jgi:hypothetical protein
MVDLVLVELNMLRQDVAKLQYPAAFSVSSLIVHTWSALAIIANRRAE